MKKLKISIFIIFLFMTISFVDVSAKEKVKVYIFEAGGCPYCKLQEDYLKGLDSYNKKFEIVNKELYIDHIDWQKGKDYELGVKVANEFKKNGFSDASYQGTPFVVIGDLYAASSYSTTLEDVINEAYEKDSKDIVNCYEKGNTNCLEHLKEKNIEKNFDNAGVVLVIVFCTIAIICTYVIKSNKDKKEIINHLEKNKLKRETR